MQPPAPRLVLGTQAFAEKMLRTFRPEAHPAKSRALQRTAERRAHGLQQAEQWLCQGLRAAGLATADLPGLKATDPRKAALAGLVWRHTTVSQTWLAEKLRLRSAANVSQVLRRTLPTVLQKPRLLPSAIFRTSANSTTPPGWNGRAFAESVEAVAVGVGKVEVDFEFAVVGNGETGPGVTQLAVDADVAPRVLSLTFQSCPWMWFARFLAGMDGSGKGRPWSARLSSS